VGEQVQIPCRPDGQLAGDERGASCEEIAAGFGQREEDVRDFALEVGERLVAHD
jgi:hypothetical protein